MSLRYVLLILHIGVYAGAVTAGPPAGVVVHLDGDQVVVQSVHDDRIDLGTDVRGLVVWPDGDRDRWQFFTGTWERPYASVRSDFGFDFGSQSRGSGIHSTSSLELLQSTTLLAQFRSPPVTRGPGSVVTPYEGALLLNPRLTFRRGASLGAEKLSAVEGVLIQGEKELLRIRFPGTATTVNWLDIPDLPDGMKKGLPAGIYRLELPTPTGQERVNFTVAESSVRDQVLASTDALAALLPQESPLAAQVAVEELLAHRPPLLVDAMDRIEKLPEEKQTRRLRILKQHVAERLQDPGQRPGLPVSAEEATGDPVIDAVRNLIAASYWEAALEDLDSLEAEESPEGKRRQALEQLYRGVILSESGAGKEQEAAAAFRKAIALLEAFPNNQRDLYRAHNNFGNFLLGRAADRLHNHAFQMAAGVRLPLVTALQNWIEAKQQYDAALTLAKTRRQKAAVQLNLARQHALLADIIRTLADPADPKQRFEAAEEIATSTAKTLARQVLNSDEKTIDPFVQAVAEELVAQLSFREGDISSAKSHATRSLARYVDQGALSGVISAHRLLGLLESNSGSEESAIGHFEVSERLSEILRSRYPSDRSGMSLSGFMSRRVYVSEKIVDLLANAGKAQLALDHVELAKARVFSNLLQLAKTGSDDPPIVPVSQVLLNWPEKTVVFEYFITTERCWLFVVTHSGVQTFTLTTPDDQEIKPRELLTKVRLARAMLNDYKRLWQDEAFTRRFDDSWQYQLHELYQTLMPKDARRHLEGAERVVIVPHHILHYLPFTALVTRVDKDAGGTRMARPSFFLDEPFPVSYAPSLSSWRMLTDKKMQPIKRIGVVADTRPEANLREVATEVQAIRDSFGHRVEAVHDGEGATVQNALRVLAKSDVAFFGCHGQNDWDSPLNGHLLLSDQNLTANSLLAEVVTSQIVVLSACHSGLADRSPLPGDDLFGLERVLLARGANCVVSGSWLVDDLRGARITSAMMDNLARGMVADQALADAQRTVLERYRSSTDERLRFFSHPHFWAVFKLSGVYDPPTSSKLTTTAETTTDTSEPQQPVSPVAKDEVKTIGDSPLGRHAFAAASRNGRVQIRNGAKGYNVFFEIDDRRHQLAPDSSAWYQIASRGSNLVIIGGKPVSDNSRQPPKGGGFKRSLADRHVYLIAAVTDRPGTTERLREFVARDVGVPVASQGVAQSIWIENPYSYPIHYSLNGSSFSVESRQTRWHKHEDSQFSIEFDSRFEKGYQKRAYRLHSGSRNYFREVENGLDLYRR